MAQPFSRNAKTWLAYILLALYAYFLNIFGPITPFLRDEFGLSYTLSSLHFSAFAVGILVVGFLGHVVIYRLGRWQAMAVGALGLGLGALLLVLGRTPVVTIGAAFLMGCVGSLILAVVPAALSQEHGELRAVAFSEANLLSSLLSTAAPLLVGWLAGLLVGWRAALWGGALISFAVGGVLLRSAPAPEGTASAQSAGRRGLPFLFWYYWLALVAAVAVEFCSVYWAANYMESELGLARASAAQSVSLFLGGMIVGRLAGSRLLRFFSARKLVLASALLALAGFLLYWGTRSIPAAMVGLALSGLGTASLYPLILSLAIGAAGEDESQAGARTTLASGTAILLLPLALGRLADVAGLRAAFIVVGLLLAVLLVMMLAARRAAAR